MLQILENLTHGHVPEAIIIASIALILHLFFTVLLTMTAKAKGHKAIVWFFVCLIFGICGYIVTAALPDDYILYVLDDIADRVDAISEGNENSGIIPETQTEAPSGTTAYMPRRKSSNDTQDKAVENIQRYWRKGSPNPNKKEKKKKDKPVKEKKVKVKKVKAKKVRKNEEEEF